MIVINPTYEYLREWIEKLPSTFSTSGTVIYDARNQIRILQTPDQHEVCVKRFHQPNWFNRIIYTWFRTPKAVRAYENALRLLQLGIDTPTPIGYILEGGTLLSTSYLITIKSPLQHTFYDFRDGLIRGKEELIAAFARWIATIHKAGVTHKDLSPGNILYDYSNQQWHFQLVDINRMRFGTISPQQGCYNLCRLWGKRDFFELLSHEYATAMHLPQDRCLQWILDGRERFWAHRTHDHFQTDDSFSVGVIVSTYNNPNWLEKVLWGLSCQNHPAQEIIIADDGSTDDTRSLIQQYKSVLPLRHIWHEDCGFRKTTILNKAVEAAQSDYLIFIDQDLIPRRDFVQQHYLHAKANRFISGGAILLPEDLSNRITKDDVISQRIFQISWLTKNGMPWHWKMSKLWQSPLLCRIMNIITPTNASWNGGNSSTWRSYIIQANGFDTRMRYGAEDREFGERLKHNGIKSYQLRYGTPLLHLYHTRPYRNEQDWQNNRQIWKQTNTEKKTQTPFGIYPLS